MPNMVPNIFANSDKDLNDSYRNDFDMVTKSDNTHLCLIGGIAKTLNIKS